MLSVFDQGPWPPCPDRFNLAAHVLAAGTRTPDKVALAILGPARAERWSYARLEAAVRGTAAGLAAAGVEPGDRVVLRLGNTADFPLAFLGAVAMGALPVPLSAALTGAEVARLLPGLGPALVLHDERLALPATDAPVAGLERLRAWRELPPADYAMGSPDRPAYMVFTSGTSGNPRAVIHAHRAIWARGMMGPGWHDIRASDRVLHAGAFNWTYTLGTGLLDPWAAGATALIPAEGTGAEALALLLRRHDATVFAAVPAIYRRMLAAGGLDLPKLRRGLSAGEKLSAAIRAGWRAATGTDIHEAYGMSECSTFISGSATRPAPEGASGHPQPGRRVAILGADGQPVPKGAPGEIAVSRRDPGLFLGYHGAAAEAASRMSGEWFRTGDGAVMADDGAITYLGRLDDMMNAGGVRVSPLEVEAALAPLATEIAVTEVAVKADTTVIAAFYAAPSALDPAACDAFAAERLARYKCPRIWVHLPALPRTATGKIDRRALRRDHEASR